MIAEWQQVRPDEWIFGEKVRGLVRLRLAEVYFDEGAEGREGGWVWMTHAELPARGKTAYLWDAVRRCEAALEVPE